VKTLKTMTCFVLRLALYMPLAALAYLFDGLRMLCERVSDGLFDMASATRQMTMAPYVREIEKSIEDAKRRDLEVLLNSLK
jgi:hypothetical protein